VSYVEKEGNLFDSKADALVNTVNCEGAMGKGVALEFRRRFPAMFDEYRVLCEEGKLHPGQIWPYGKSTPAVLNFAIKSHWRLPSKLEWVEETLQKFVENYKRLGLGSAAFPWMGAMNGGLAFEDVQSLTRKYLRPLDDIDIEVYTFNPAAPDPLFRTLRKHVQSHSAAQLQKLSGLIKRHAEAVWEAVQHEDVTSMATLLAAAGLGSASADKLYAFLVSPPSSEPTALELGLDL